MADPQDDLKVWLAEKLADRGIGSIKALAKHLGLSSNAVSRMKNRGNAGQARKIEAHMVPKIADFFGEWPPGYRAKNGGARKMPDGKGKGKNASDSAKDVMITDVEGTVTVIDKSTTVVGDSATVTGIGSPELPPEASQLLGALNEAIDTIYRNRGRDLSVREIGELSAEHYNAILAACRTPAEFPHALEIVKIRVTQAIEAGEEKPNEQES